MEGTVDEDQSEGNRRPLYLAYLLRLWPVENQQPGWRASLRYVQIGRQGEAQACRHCLGV